jgi:hypothetical protein
LVRIRSSPAPRFNATLGSGFPFFPIAARRNTGFKLLSGPDGWGFS